VPKSQSWSRSGMGHWAIRFGVHQHADPTGSPDHRITGHTTRASHAANEKHSSLLGFQVEFLSSVDPGAIAGHPAGRGGRLVARAFATSGRNTVIANPAANTIRPDTNYPTPSQFMGENGTLAPRNFSWLITG